MKILKYVITIMDVRTNTCYNDTVNSETEVLIKIRDLKKNTDCKIISVNALLLEMRPLDLEELENKIM